jgi:hypothetical protein
VGKAPSQILLPGSENHVVLPVSFWTGLNILVTE